MTEDIRSMTTQLANDPTSLVFLPLGEALRRRRQLDAAVKVALAGLGRYPDLADAHDLYARILGDQGDFERAFDEWDITLRLDPEHVGAHKGIGYLYFVAGDLDRALLHLETAAERLPEDSGVHSALERVRQARGRQASVNGGPPSAPAHRTTEATISDDGAVFAGLEGARDGLILLDTKGLRLGGGLKSPDGSDVADAVSAHLAGLSHEAERTARLLGLGEWTSLAAEAEDAHWQVVAPTPETLLLQVRERSIPLGRLAVLTERAAQVARVWLDGLR